MSGSLYLEELRLTAFKSFLDATLPLHDLTLVVGRNASGKSNAIDGLQVLGKLAQGEDVRDAIEGSKHEGGAGVRGGVRGCAPFGSKAFSLGCRVRAAGDVLEYDIEVQVDPDVQITEERLTCDGQNLLVTDPHNPDSLDLLARYDNGKPGPNPALPFRATRMLITQTPTKLPASNSATRRVQQAAAAVVEALQAIFVLDPVPSLMRQYVPARDTLLRRDAENLSAAVGALQGDPQTWARLREVVQSLPEQPVDGVSVQASSLGDVILALEERQGDMAIPVSARVMSDGMLRFLAFATALLGAPLIQEDAQDGRSHTMLVMEEIENGLHPSQAARVVQLIREESSRRAVRTLATTHSPAMLSALSAEDHEGVVVCDRDPVTSVSRLTRLVDLEAYPRALAQGSLGEAVVNRRLEGDAPDREAALRALDEILG